MAAGFVGRGMTRGPNRRQRQRVFRPAGKARPTGVCAGMMGRVAKRRVGPSPSLSADVYPAEDVVGESLDAP
jgi:hypothetical protein